MGKIYYFEYDSLKKEYIFKKMNFNLPKDQFYEKLAYLRKKKSVSVKGSIYLTYTGKNLNV